MRTVIKDEVIYESWRDTRNLYFNDDDLIARIKGAGAEILICEGDNVKKRVIEGTDLKIIGSTRDDPNNVDVEAATSKGIPVIFAPKRNTISVVELAVSLILALARKLHVVDRIVHSKEFHVEEFSDYVKYYNMFRGMELHGKTVGIVGLGAIGFEVARRLAPFGVKILVHDPYVGQERLKAVDAKAVPLDDLMAASDFVTLHCPPFDETDGMIGARQIGLMKPTAFLVNLARASVTDEAALLAALKEKRIAGAAIDVFSNEPVDHENEFLELDNVIVTPHIGGDTQDTNHRHATMMVDAIEAILKREVPPNVINPEALGGTRPPKLSVPPASDQDALLDLRKGIVDICYKLAQKGYVVATAGNVSARVKTVDGAERYLVTPSTKDYSSMEPDDLVLVDGSGAVIEGTRNPTSERLLHIKVYQARPDVHFIIHSHAPFSTVLSIARTPIGPFVDEILPFIGGCNVAEYGEAGSEELAENTVKALGDNYAALISNHGNVCVGVSAEHAWRNCELVEFAAKIQYRASQLGTIYAIPEEAEAHAKEIFEIMKDAQKED
ncbi:MAG: class II aldolase/adducin family protein [Candidatus Lokiarchaeota archaeon]|nr:class II aldolase/adducin family protein [Candidatus Lokiarchaeota archaeon]